MQRWIGPVMTLVSVLAGPVLTAQTTTGVHAGADEQSAAPLPDSRTLLLDVERNEKWFEALQKNYTYHVHLEQDELRKDGSVKNAKITDSESLTINGVRVDRVVARNGKPLSPEEQAKENERLDKEIAKARAREAKATNKGEDTDGRGNAILPASRILELGTFSNERRVDMNGRPTIVLDYAGDPKARTHSQIEEIVRDLVGTIWVDETERVLVRGEGHFLNDFKIGAGLLADVRKGSSFQFESKRVSENVWLPASVDGQGSIRLLLFAGFTGRLHLVTSDYRQFRTSATILPGQIPVDPDGNPLAGGAVTTTQPPRQ